MKRSILCIGVSVMVVLAGIPLGIGNFVKPVQASQDNSSLENNVPKLRINAINPGYTVGGKANSGEMIELYNYSGGPLTLTGIKLIYTNSSGNSSVIFEFPEGSIMTGKTLLLRLSSSPEAKEADIVYTKTLALAAGPLELSYNGDVISDLCWTGKGDCYKAFNAKTPTMLLWNEEKEVYEHVAEYKPDFSPDKERYIVPTKPDEKGDVVTPQCRGLQISELLSYYETVKTEQFIELYNPTDHAIKLDGCFIRYKKKNYLLSGTIEADKYFARYATDFTLTKNPTTENAIEIVDVDGKIVDNLKYYNGQKKTVAYAQFGYNEKGERKWLQTYHPTPGEANDYQRFKTCEVGKVLNEETGNCVKATTIATALEDCPPGKYRNPLTNRCKAVVSTASTELKPCAEGYERNPETNRCRKIKDNNGAAYGLEPEQLENNTTWIILAVILAVVLFGLGYTGWQFRDEIRRKFRKVFRST